MTVQTIAARHDQSVYHRDIAIPEKSITSLFFFYIASVLFKKHAHSHRPHTSCQTVELLMQLTAAVSGKETEGKTDMELYL